MCKNRLINDKNLFIFAVLVFDLRRFGNHARLLLPPLLPHVPLHVLVHLLPGQNHLEQSLLPLRPHWISAHTHGWQQILVRWCLVIYLSVCLCLFVSLIDACACVFVGLSMDCGDPLYEMLMCLCGITHCCELRFVYLAHIYDTCFSAYGFISHLMTSLLFLKDIYSILHCWSEEVGCWLGGGILNVIPGSPLAVWPLQVGIFLKPLTVIFPVLCFWSCLPLLYQTDSSCGVSKPVGGAWRRSHFGSDRWLSAVFWRYSALRIFLCQLLPLYELAALQHWWVILFLKEYF